MATPTTNVTVAPPWKQPLREQIARAYDGNAMTQQFDSLEKYLELIRPIHFFYTAAVENHTTPLYPTMTIWNGTFGGENNSDLMKAPHDCTMHVAVYGWQGGNSAANQAHYGIFDEGGVSICLSDFGGGYILDNNHTGLFSAIAMNGRKHYNAGQTIGYRLGVGLSTSNVYARAGVHVSIFPRRRSAVAPL